MVLRGGSSADWLRLLSHILEGGSYMRLVRGLGEGWWSFKMLTYNLIICISFLSY